MENSAKTTSLQNYFISVIFFLLAVAGFCQTNTGVTAGTPASGEGHYRFSSDTAWGKVNVLVSDHQGNFKVQVKSYSPALGWTLKEENGGRTLSKGGLNPTGQFQFEVNQPFKGFYRLTVYLGSDREEVPAVIHLSAQKENKEDKPAAESLDDYQDFPDHPYNNMVKNLYDQAVGDYGKGDNLHALNLLKKASELDPAQPQVRILLEKIQGSTDKTQMGPLDGVRSALKKGNKEEALAKVDDYLDANPGDPQALELKDQIEGKVNSHRALNKALARAKKAEKSGEISQAVKWYSKVLDLEPGNGEAAGALERLKGQISVSPAKKKQAKLSDTDATAQADQTYNLGLDSYRQGDYAAAKKFWEETLQFQPTHLQAQRNLGRLRDEHPELK